MKWFLGFSHLSDKGDVYGILLKTFKNNFLLHGVVVGGKPRMQLNRQWHLKCTLTPGDNLPEQASCIHAC